MSRCLLIVLALFSTTVSAIAMDVSSLRDLPVLDGGRVKPFDTLARDTVRLVTGKETFGVVKEAPDGSQTFVQRWEPVEVILHWCHPINPSDTEPTIYVPNLELRGKLGMKPAQKWIAPQTLRDNEKLWEEFRAIDARVKEAESAGEVIRLTAMEQAIRDLSLRMDYYFSAMTLRMVAVVPAPNSAEAGKWVALSQFMDGRITDPAAAGVEVGWDKLMEGYHTGSQSMFDEGVLELKRTILKLAGPGYADRPAMGREVLYNHLHPFRLAWIAYFISLAALVVSLIVRRRVAYWVAMGLFVFAIGVNVFGFILRCRVTGWAPVTNMYETVVWVAMTGSLFALVMELIYRTKMIAIAGAVVAVLACVVADVMPANLGRQITPLTAVLRSNLWLTVHVLTIVSSYAAFALALVLGNVALFQFIRPRARVLARATLGPGGDGVRETVAFCYRAIQIGVLLIAAGTILGGLWADVSWGRFWGWDPKEVWALIVLLVYLALLHGRYAGWIGPFGLAAGAVLCFTAVLMSWYGVNFVLGAGLHSYGFGQGGQEYVLPFVLLQWAYVGIAALLYKRRGIASMNGTTADAAERVPAAGAVAVGD